MNTAFLFAAGRGLRLRPLTDLTPKPLCTINDIPLIDYHLEKLANSAIKNILINHAYLGGQIKQHLRHHPIAKQLNITYIPEPPGGYQTGGTLLNALPRLENQPFLAINADVFTDYDFSTLVCPKNRLAHLILIKNPIPNTQSDFSLSTTYELSHQNPDCLFSGIACYHPRLFQHKTRGRVSLVPWIQAAADKHLVSGEIYTGLWFDTGNLTRLTKARQAAEIYSGSMR